MGEECQTILSVFAVHRPFYISIYIDMIVTESEDVVKGYFNGSFKNVAKHFSVSLSFVTKLWKQCCETGDMTAQQESSNNPLHLKLPDVELIQSLKSSKPSIHYAKVLDAVNAHCDIPAGTSHYERPIINSREERIELADLLF